MRASRTRRRIARVLNVLILAGLALAFGPPPAPPAEAAPKQALFIFGADQFNSYWRNQREVQVQPPQCPPVGPCLSIPVRLSNPDGADALPVSVSPETAADGTVSAQPEKMSAIAFDLVGRGVEPGSELTMFTLSILEEGARSADGKVIKACRITDIWPHNETGAELWANRPPYDDGNCVAGRRDVAASGEIRWLFTLSTLGRPWASDPLENNGVMLVPDMSGAASTDSWQITLKVPLPDNPTTGDANEYEETKTRVRIVYDFRPPPPEPPPDDGGGDGGSGGSGGGGGPVGPVDPGPTGPTDPGPTPTSEPTPTADPEPVADTKPGPPGQVWLLIPVGLIALAMTRAAVDEPAGETTTGRGVVTAIRRRNATARGEGTEGPAPESKLKRLLGRFRR